MNMFENAVEKIGEAFGVVASTTEKAVDVGKQKYNIAVLNNKLEKQYALLGKLFYESNKAVEVTASYKAAVDEITQLISQIKDAEEQLENIKK